MAEGKVKWFNNAKGFGFIVPEDGGEDIFAHYSTLNMEGYRSLKAGLQVTFEIQHGPKGLHAEEIGVENDVPEREGTVYFVDSDPNETPLDRLVEEKLVNGKLDKEFDLLSSELLLDWGNGEPQQ